MTITLYFLQLVIGVAILVKAADWFTDASVDVARRLRVPEIVVGATIVSLATTLPEFAVSFVAVLEGEVDMAVGNAVGSTICNVGLILGLCALLAPMGVARVGFVFNGLGLLLFAAIFGALGFIFPEGSRWVGVAMLTCLLTYVISTIHSSLNNRSVENIAEGQISLTLLKTVMLFVVGAVGVVGGSRLMVGAAKAIALKLGVSELIVSLTFVAIGTSTPEFVVSISGIIKKQRGLAIGNIIGANILNLAWVLGACSLVSPLPLTRETLYFDIPIMLIMSVLLLVFGLTDKWLARWEGGVLFAIYLFFLIMRFAVLAQPPAAV